MGRVVGNDGEEGKGEECFQSLYDMENTILSL